MGASKTLKQSQKNQVDIAGKAQQLGTANADQSQGSFDQRSSLLQKPIDYFSSVASGNPSAMLTAAAPGLSNISKQSQSAKGNIMETIPAGAARQYALSLIDRGKAGQGADFLNQAYMQSFPALQGIAKDTGDFGLQRLGAGYRGLEAAGQGNQAVIQSETQRQAAKMNMIGSVAGMAGGAMGGAGGIGKMFSRKASAAAAPVSSGWGTVQSSSPIGNLLRK